MDWKQFLREPENRKRVSLVLVGIIMLSLGVLFVRSCRRPDAETLTGYLAALADAEPGRRIDAALGLGRLEVLRAVPDLERVFLNDPDERVRRAAAYSLLVLDRDRLLALARESGSEETRRVALETLIRSERDRAFIHLEQGLRDTSPLVRRVVLDMVPRFGGARSTGLLFAVAENTREETALRVRALSLLGQAAGPGALDNLRQLARREPPGEVRETAAAAVRSVEERSRQ